MFCISGGLEVGECATPVCERAGVCVYGICVMS